MNRILAIAAITLRSAIRSRVVVGLLLVLLVTIIGLPLTVKGDGTVSGTMQVLLTYTLSLVSVILSLVTLWAGCAAISLEVAERQIHMVVTKPVSRIQIWAGKWIGLMILNAVLLAVAGGTILGILAWKERTQELTDEERTELETEILVARQRVHPDFPDVSAEAREVFARQQEALKAQAAQDPTAGTPAIPPHPEDALAAIRQAILAQRHSAGPNETISWTFPLPPAPAEHPLHLRFRFSSSDMSASQVLGRWRIGTPDRPQRFEQVLYSSPGGFHTLVVPPESISEDGSLHVEYTNRNPDPIAVVFSPDDGPDVFVYRGGFLGNLTRALLIEFFQIAFLAALGVTAGALFSMPVASFLALFGLILLYSLNYVEMLATKPVLTAVVGPAAPAIANHLLQALFTVLHLMLAPLQGHSPLELLGVGEMVPWSAVGWSFAVRIVLYGCGMGLVGGWLFNRRELGLPS